MHALFFLLVLSLCCASFFFLSSSFPLLAYEGFPLSCAHPLLLLFVAVLGIFMSLSCNFCSLPHVMLAVLSATSFLCPSLLFALCQSLPVLALSLLLFFPSYLLSYLCFSSPLPDFIPFSLFSVCSFFSPSSTLSFFALLLFMFLWISVSQSNPHAPFQVSEILILTFLLSFASLVVFACSFCHFCSTTPLYLPL